MSDDHSRTKKAKVVATAPARRKKSSAEPKSSTSGESTKKSSLIPKSSPIRIEPVKQVNPRSFSLSSSSSPEGVKTYSQLAAGQLRLQQLAIEAGYTPPTPKVAPAIPPSPLRIPVPKPHIPEQPIENEIAAPLANFWANVAQPKEVKKAARIPVGEKSKHLASLSNMREKIEPRLEKENEPDEIENCDEEPSQYLDTEAEKKKKKAASMEAMKATRAAKPAVVEPKPRPDAFALFKLAGMKRDSREQCGICNQSILSSALAKHSEECFRRQSLKAQSKSPAPAPLPAALPVKKAMSNFRPGNTDPVKKLAPKPAAPPPKQNEKGPALDQLFSPKKVDKGKGKAKEIPPPIAPPMEEEEDYFNDGEDFDEDIFNHLDQAQEVIIPRKIVPPIVKPKAPPKLKPKVVAKKPIDVIEIDDDEEDYEDDAPLATISSKVNTKKRPGPPDDSSPPKASIYLSTLPNHIKDGYEHMYVIKDPKGGYDINEPQKMTPKVPFKPRGGRGKGRGKARGGARRK